jgi:serine protease
MAAPRPALARIGAVALAAALAAPAAAQPRSDATDRLIVRLADWADSDRAQPMHADRARALSLPARSRLEPYRRMSGGAHVVRLTHAMPVAEVEAMALRLMSDPAVAHAEPDRRKFPLRLAADPLFARQWSLVERAGGINAPAAWDITVGSPAVVVAVLDTGVRPDHPDLAGRLAPGYDFVREDAPGLALTANDGDGRDPDPADPGDWLTAAEAGQPPFTGCPEAGPSSWHGTHTAGIIAAVPNNGFGIAGIAWAVRVLPARVLGKCGGYTSDIIDAVRWAAGLPVPGVPANASPAQVLNLSLGGAGACSPEEQRALDDALATGRVKAIVTAAGNDAGDSRLTTPANCRGALAVTATDRTGARAPYASVGANVALAAPGGAFAADAASGANGILSLFNTGPTTPGAPTFAFAAGTSEAAAHVSGVVALMVSVAPNLAAADVRRILATTARTFPDGTCSPTLCGAGIVDAAAAVATAVTPAAATPPAPEPAPMPVSMTTAPAAAPAAADTGGGCTIARGGAPEAAFPLLALWALASILVRRRRESRTRRA